MSEAFAWRPIDTAPDDRRILLSDGVQVAVGQWSHWGGVSKGGWNTEGPEFFEPTYWMPLPEAPKNAGPPP